MNRAIRIVLLTAFMTLAVGAVFLAQGKKGQVQDPVCGLWVDKTKELSYTHKGDTYYFCSSRDMTLFKENPTKYTPKK